MSSVFKQGKTKTINSVEVTPEIVDNSEIVRNLENKRRKRMGAVSQLLSHNNSYERKTTLGQ